MERIKECCNWKYNMEDIQKRYSWKWDGKKTIARTPAQSQNENIHVHIETWMYEGEVKDSAECSSSLKLKNHCI